MLINLSNHSKINWADDQLTNAMECYGAIMDIPFPRIDPGAEKEEVRIIADEYLKKIINFLKEYPDCKNAVHIMGEFTFVYYLLKILEAEGIKAVASTTERLTVEKNGQKISEFNFKKFREYF